MDLIAIALIISAMILPSYLLRIETEKIIVPASEQIWKQKRETTNNDLERVIFETLSQQSKDLKLLLLLSQKNKDHLEEMAKNYEQLVDKPKRVDRADLFLPSRRSDNMYDDALDDYNDILGESNSDGKNNNPNRINNTPNRIHVTPAGNYNAPQNNATPDRKNIASDTNNETTLVSIVKLGLNIPKYSRLFGHHISNEINNEIDPIRELIQQSTAANKYN